MQSPLDPIRIVSKRLGEVAAELGLELHQVSIIPGPPELDGHAPDIMQVMFTIGEQAVDPTGYEQRQTDATFAEMTRQFAETEQDTKLEAKKPEIESEIKSWLEDG